MYELECLTIFDDDVEYIDECSPFFGACYPDVEGCCGPDCSPN